MSLYSFGGLFSRVIQTGEDLVHMGGVGLAGEKAYQRDEDNIEYHHDSARVYGRVDSQPADCEGMFAECEVEHMRHGKAYAADEGSPDGGFGDVLHIQTPHEGGDECACERAPRDGHEGRDNGLGVIEGDYRENAGDEQEHGYEYAHYEHFPLLVHLIFHKRLYHIEREGGAGSEHERREGGHRSRENEDYHHAEKQLGQALHHRGDNSVEAVYRLARFVSADEKSAEAALKVTAARDYEGEHGRDNGTAADSFFVLDSVEFSYHLRQTPCAERGKDNNAEEVYRVGAEKAVVRVGIALSVGYLTEKVEGVGKTAVFIEDSYYNSGYADEHENTLNKVIERGSLIAADDNVYGGDKPHYDDTDSVIDVESLFKEAGEAVESGSGIGDKEDEDYHGGSELQALTGVAVFKKLGHSACVEVFRHYLSTPTEDYPREERAYNGIAHAYPSGAHAVIPAELTRIADENYRREVRSTVSESGEPRAESSAAEHIIRSAVVLFSVIRADADHQAEVQSKNDPHCHKRTNPLHHITDLL